MNGRSWFLCQIILLFECDESQFLIFSCFEILTDGCVTSWVRELLHNIVCIVTSWVMTSEVHDIVTTYNTGHLRSVSHTRTQSIITTNAGWIYLHPCTCGDQARNCVLCCLINITNFDLVTDSVVQMKVIFDWSMYWSH